MNFDLCFVGTATTSFELCNDYTTRGHTPRILATSHREARPKGRITLSPRTHRLAPVEGDGERCTHESRRLCLATPLFWERIGRETPSRGPSREGRDLAPARRCPEHPVVIDFVCVRLEKTRAESESIEASHMRWFYPLHGGVTRPGTRAAKRRAPREEPRCLRYVRMERVSKIALRRPAATGLRWRRRLLLKEHGDARRADAFFTLRPPPPLTGTEAAEGSTCLAGGASPKRALCSECRSQRRERRLRPRSCAG